MILDQLKSKVVEYYKAKDALRLGVLRYYLSKVKDKEMCLAAVKNNVHALQFVPEQFRNEIRQELGIQ
mgnify:CR=1 FL=1